MCALQTCGAWCLACFASSSSDSLLNRPVFLFKIQDRLQRWHEQNTNTLKTNYFQVSLQLSFQVCIHLSLLPKRKQKENQIASIINRAPEKHHKKTLLGSSHLVVRVLVSKAHQYCMYWPLCALIIHHTSRICDLKQPYSSLCLEAQTLKDRVQEHVIREVPLNKSKQCFFFLCWTNPTLKMPMNSASRG